MHDRIPTPDLDSQKCLCARSTSCLNFGDGHFGQPAWESWLATAEEIADNAWKNCEVLGALIMLRTATPEFEDAIRAIEETDTVRILGFSLLLLASFAEEHDVEISKIFRRDRRT